MCLHWLASVPFTSVQTDPQLSSSLAGFLSSSLFKPRSFRALMDILDYKSLINSAFPVSCWTHRIYSLWESIIYLINSNHINILCILKLNYYKFFDKKIIACSLSSWFSVSRSAKRNSKIQFIKSIFDINLPQSLLRAATWPEGPQVKSQPFDWWLPLSGSSLICSYYLWLVQGHWRWETNALQLPATELVLPSDILGKLCGS